MRTDVIGDPLLELIRAELLEPERIARGLDLLPAKVAARCPCVLPLDSSWAANWDLKIETRPREMIVPKVAPMFGCGGRI